MGMLNKIEFKTFSKHLEAEKAERAAKPWFIRIPLNVGEFLWYRVILRLQDIPQEIKWKVQELTRGYSDCDIWNLNYFIVKKIRAPLKEYVKYQSEKGKSLPNEFATDPAAWLVVLRKIEYAFDSGWNEGQGNYGLDGMSDNQITEHFKKVQEGWELFGKYAQNLWD